MFESARCGRSLSGCGFSLAGVLTVWQCRTRQGHRRRRDFLVPSKMFSGIHDPQCTCFTQTAVSRGSRTLVLAHHRPQSSREHSFPACTIWSQDLEPDLPRNDGLPRAQSLEKIEEAITFTSKHSTRLRSTCEAMNLAGMLAVMDRIQDLVSYRSTPSNFLPRTSSMYGLSYDRAG